MHWGKRENSEGEGTLLFWNLLNLKRTYYANVQVDFVFCAFAMTCLHAFISYCMCCSSSYHPAWSPVCSDWLAGRMQQRALSRTDIPNVALKRISLNGGAAPGALPGRESVWGAALKAQTQVILIWLTSLPSAKSGEETGNTPTQFN